jgi:ferredoxin-NADP reductase/Na+-translocating ferredoxin:NAD+ oxidoreductase RnfD subunit
MLYYLTVIFLVAVIFCFTGIMPYGGLDLIYSAAVLIAVCWVTNKTFGRILGIQTNIESDYISAFILALIITPGAPLLFLILAAVFSQASKYILNIRGKHIFNPAAIGVVATILVIGQGASWWIGNIYILPVIVIGGLLVARKIQRFDLILSFLVVYLATTIYYNRSGEVGLIIKSAFLDSALLYFTFVMLTEPMTSPTTRKMRIVYGAIIGFLFGFTFTIGKLYSSPELALVLGNIFAFLVSTKARYKLKFKSKEKIAEGIYKFVFESNRKINFKPGQYLEWTLGYKKPDVRGNRRYFTIASSPTEDDVMLGVRFYDQPSTFKQTLLALNPGDKVFAGQLAGDFVLPNDSTKKLVFIAGGIGITPFRSMIKYLIDKNEKRPITLFYTNRSESEVAFKDILDQGKQLGMNIKLVITEKDGRVNKEMIEKEVSNLQEHMFYISGSRNVVDSFKDLLLGMGVSRAQIKVDFFPGFV